MEHKYYINKLYICNFKPFVYGTNDEKPYVEINFGNGDKKIYSIIFSGPNGYGKTSIFQAIYFALTGNIEIGNYVDGRKKIQEHVIINDLSKCCFVAIELKDEVSGSYVTLIRYAKKGIPQALRKTEEEAADFKTYILEERFNYNKFKTGTYEEKRRKDIEKRFGEKNILEWIRRNYIQQEHTSDLILKSDKERVNFLNNYIEQESGSYFSEVKALKVEVEEDIKVLENEIKDLAKKIKLEIKEIQGERPDNIRVYPEADYIWDKEIYEESEPFHEYEEYAKRVLEIVSRLPEYVSKRKVELLEGVKRNEYLYENYVLHLFEASKKKEYKFSYLKKQYLKKLLGMDNEFWKEKLNEDYLTKETISEIQSIRDKRQDYNNSLNHRQFLYSKIEELRENIRGKEEDIEDIFQNQCPLCGSAFNEKNISLAQAIRQAENIFKETEKILDSVLEEKKQAWNEECKVVKIQIEKWIREEIGEENIYTSLQNEESSLNIFNELKKKLVELYKLEGEELLTVFIDKEKFGKQYKEISEYEKAVSDLKAVLFNISEATEKAVTQQGDEKYEIDVLAYSENRNKIVLFTQMDSRVEQLKEKIRYLEWKKREKNAFELSVNKNAYVTKIEEIKILYEYEMKLNKVLECQLSARKEYLNEIMKYIEIPLYIYSGKLIQTHQSGLGIFCYTGIKEDALTEFKMSTTRENINQKLDVSNKFSTGQKNVTNIALMLALKKIAATKLDIFMIDDPCQSLDELNIASFVEIIKNEFSSTQIILSTHEDRIASYIKYKNDKAGKEMIMFNVQEELYGM